MPHEDLKTEGLEEISDTVLRWMRRLFATDHAALTARGLPSGTAHRRLTYIETEMDRRGILPDAPRPGTPATPTPPPPETR